MAILAAKGLQKEEKYQDDKRGGKAMPAMNALAIKMTSQRYPSYVFE